MQPVNPTPPHWPHWAVAPEGQLPAGTVVVGGGVDEGGGVDGGATVGVVVGGAVVGAVVGATVGPTVEEGGDAAHPLTVLHLRGRLRELLPT